MKAMMERHTVMYRLRWQGAECRGKVCKTYAAALRHGMLTHGYGCFWVVSEKKSPKAKRWTEFTPPQPDMTEPYEE